MAKVQFIRTPAGDDLAVLTRDEYERLTAEADRADADEMRRIDRLIREGREEMLPFAMVERMIAGTHPVRAWREHRGLTGADVAARAGISPGYLSQIETGKRAGTFRTMCAIARALGVEVDDLQIVRDAASGGSSR